MCANRGKHRTEVTEATERGLGLVGELKLVDTAVVGRELRESGKRRTERGIELALPANGEEKRLPFELLRRIELPSLPGRFATNPISLCGLCDLCAMLSSDSCRSRPVAAASTRDPSFCGLT